MTWTAKMEHVLREEIETWKKAAEADPSKRHIRCDPDPEQEEYFLCLYEERITPAN